MPERNRKRKVTALKIKRAFQTLFDIEVPTIAVFSTLLVAAMNSNRMGLVIAWKESFLHELAYKNHDILMEVFKFMDTKEIINFSSASGNEELLKEVKKFTLTSSDLSLRDQNLLRKCPNVSTLILDFLNVGDDGISLVNAVKQVAKFNHKLTSIEVPETLFEVKVIESYISAVKQMNPEYEPPIFLVRWFQRSFHLQCADETKKYLNAFHDQHPSIKIGSSAWNHLVKFGSAEKNDFENVFKIKKLIVSPLEPFEGELPFPIQSIETITTRCVDSDKIARRIDKLRHFLPGVKRIVLDGHSRINVDSMTLLFNELTQIVHWDFKKFEKESASRIIQSLIQCQRDNFVSFKISAYPNWLDKNLEYLTISDGAMKMTPWFQSLLTCVQTNSKFRYGISRVEYFSRAVF